MAVGLVALAGIVIAGNLAEHREGEVDPGLTTEVAMLLMYCIGAYLPVGHRAVAVALGGSVAVLLYLKPQLHELAARIGDRDFTAVMQFVVVTLVILPVLPDRAFGPYQVWNPHKIWLLVVLIVSINLAGYVMYKFLGDQTGTVVSGILGGLISSTATTVSYARRARQSPESAGLAALVIAIASAVVYARLLVVIGTVAPEILRELGPPLAVTLVVLTAFVVAMALSSRQKRAGMPDHENPTELKSAVVFAGLFSVVLLTVAAAKENFGDGGLYVVGLIAGLTDVDAITLSTVQLVQKGNLGADTAWRVILTASMSNMVFKAATVAMLGDRQLLTRAGTFFGGALVTGVLLLSFWPH